MNLAAGCSDLEHFGKTVGGYILKERDLCSARQCGSNTNLNTRLRSSAGRQRSGDCLLLRFVLSHCQQHHHEYLYVSLGRFTCHHV